MQGRFDVLNQILKLDPQRDHQRIVYLVGAYEYPWLLRKSLEFALFRTYAVPSISRILAESGQFERYGQKRYDDTSLLIAEFTEHGYDSERGRAAIRRMNQLHRRWNISNDDYLYVLSTFIYVPIAFHEQFGWRQPTQHENLANFYFWSEVGKRMNIQAIPATFEAFKQFHHDYERQQFRYSPENARIGNATIDIFQRWYPAFLRPLIREVIYCFMDDRLRDAFGFPKPHSALKFVVRSGLWLMGRFIRYGMPPRRKPFHLTQAPNRTYPHGYEIEKMGPVS